MTRIALDSNVLVYAAGVVRGEEDARKGAEALVLIGALMRRATLVLPVQALGELLTVLTRTGRSREVAQEVVLDLRRGADVVASTEATLRSALDRATSHRLQLWDALILAAAAEAGCSLLLSEDMHPGFARRGTAVANPFAASPDRRLSSLLA